MKNLVFLLLFQLYRSQLLITSLIKDVDISDRYIQVHTKFTLFNPTQHFSDLFTHYIQKNHSLYYYYLEDSNTQQLYSSFINYQNPQYNLYVFQISLQPQQQLQLSLFEYYYNRYDPLPKKINLMEDQLVLFIDNIYFYSPYHINHQITRYNVEKLISYSHHQNVVERGSLIEYGPYENIQPFQKLFNTLHVQNNSPLVIFKSVEKTIEVSHWGNIAISEKYQLINEGPHLSGEHSRVQYNKQSFNSGKNALKEMQVQLPLKSWGIYFRDEIGNISTSSASRGTLFNQKSILVTLNPRFGIIGGWKSNFELGYNLPTSSFLQAKDDYHLLRANLGYSIQDIIALNYTLRIIVPEGAENLLLDLSQDVDSIRNEKVHSYFDNVGRPSLVINKKLMSAHLNRPFKLSYQFESYQIYREPLMLFIAYLIFFVLLILVRRLDLVTFKLKED